MKSLWRWIGITSLLWCTPVLFACEDCYLRGMRNPAGATVERAMCWSSPDGSSEGCLPYEDGSNCQLWSYGNSCPEGSDDETGGGSGGGGGGFGGSGNCTTTTGACPPECFSCSGGGGGFLR